MVRLQKFNLKFLCCKGKIVNVSSNESEFHHICS